MEFHVSEDSNVALSATAPTDSDDSAILIYSPTQVALGTLGGPVGLVYFLWSNFSALGNKRLAKSTVLSGILLIVALVAVTPFLPESFPSLAFAILYVVIARYVAEHHQMTKLAILSSPRHDFHSNWRVLGFGILCLLGSAIVIFLPLMALIMFGIWQP